MSRINLEHTNSPPRCAIGPLNTAGQAREWAKALSHSGTVQSFSFAPRWKRSTKIQGASDRRIPHHRVRPHLVRRISAHRLLGNASHYLNESLVPFSADARDHDLRVDMEWLTDSHLTVGVVFHGSDIRDPGRHIDLNPFSFFKLMDEAQVEVLTASASLRRRVVEDLALPVFVSTPDLLQDIPSADWLPIVISADQWRAEPLHIPRKPRLLHLPSRRTPPIKGTSFIDPIMERLDSQGLIEYTSPSSLSHEAVFGAVSNSHIVVDQILTGSYGVAAVEALAAGRLVLGNVSERVRQKVGQTIPIVDCDPTNLEDVLHHILSNPEQYEELAQMGPAFVRDLHSGPASARTLLNWIGR